MTTPPAPLAADRAPGTDDEVVPGPPQELPPLPADREAARKAAGREFPCRQCGAALAFDPGVQEQRCPYCGHREPISPSEGTKVLEQDLEATLKRVAEKKTEARSDGLCEVGCKSCGAQVQFAGALTATACPYCGAPIALEGVHEAKDRIPVDGVLPFRVEQASARQNLKSWVKSRWFLPSALARDGIQAGFQGVYLPFFTFDAFTATRFSGLRGIRHTRTVGSGKNRRTVVYYTWHSVAGSFQRFFDDVLESAGSGLPDDEMRDLEPWPLQGLKPFSPQFLTGFLARTYDVSLRACFSSARDRITTMIEQDVRQRIGGDAQKIHSIETNWPGLTFKHVLLPVWLASYRFKDKPYRVVVNAATGEVQGERPWSVWKIVFLVLAILAVAGTIAAIVAANR